ncbi:CvpA family protein [Oscillibacter sp.]|uniref:CvpA family protein n=1 Tax=Oscillibacter sp. TaxID=1945593 RepID=UPI002635CDC6|nr:CvpA family protein [Oscillibacter sp.]MDD3347921.1 CvpA family protein [Oscillibacter sp.]
MTTPAIIDAVIVLVLAAFCAFGARRGLFRALAGLVAVVVALVGAGIIAATFAPPAAKLLSPVIERHIAARVDQAMAVQADKAQMPESEVENGIGVEELLALLGIDSDVRDTLTEKAQEAVRDTGVSVATAVVQSVAQTILYGTLYILSFAALTILLNVLMRAMDLVLRLPGLHALNALLGGVVGLIEGALLLFLAVWALRRLGVSFETEMLAQAHILRIFTDNTPLSVLSFLQ